MSYKGINIIFSKAELNRLLAGQKFSKSKEGIQVHMKLGDDRRQRILKKIASLQALLNKTEGDPFVRTYRKRQNKKICSICGKQVKGLSLHIYHKHKR